MRRSHPASGTEDKLLRTTRLVAAALISVAIGGVAFAEGPGDPKAVKSEDGKYFDKEGNPTFNVAADGTVDTAAITRNATSATDRTGWGRPTRLRWRNRSRP